MQSIYATSQYRLLATGLILLGLFMLASASTTAQGACAPMPDGLVSWWRAEGNARDSWGTNDGVLTNGARIATTGKVGKAFQFDGLNDQVLIPDSTSLKFSNTTSFTIELWWNRILNNLPFHALGKRPSCSPPPYYQVGIDSSFPASIRALNAWIHVAVVYDVADNLVHVYVNGTEVKTGPRPNTSATIADLLIGGSGSCAHFGGLVDEVSIYNRALTTSEIRAIVSAGSSGKCTLPPAHTQKWSLDAQITVSYPAGLSCSFLSRIGDPDIAVTNNGGLLYASETDTGGTPFVLQGTMNGNAVDFTITGFGITPGDGGCSNACDGGTGGMVTHYSGTYDPSTKIITGTVDGGGQFSSQRDQYGNFNCTLSTWSATWNGTFTARVTGNPICWQCLPGWGGWRATIQ